MSKTELKPSDIVISQLEALNNLNDPTYTRSQEKPFTKVEKLRKVTKKEQSEIYNHNLKILQALERIKNPELDQVKKERLLELKSTTKKKGNENSKKVPVGQRKLGPGFLLKYGKPEKGIKKGNNNKKTKKPKKNVKM